MQRKGKGIEREPRAGNGWANYDVGKGLLSTSFALPLNKLYKKSVGITEL